MKRIPVWIDCDTGVDDAVALLLAHALPELDIRGISVVCGNTSLENAYFNTQRINGLMGANYPVYQGAEKPLLKEVKFAVTFHGINGLGDVDLPVPENAASTDEKAWDALYACACTHPGELRLVATGPMTNLAIAFTKYPALPGLLHSVSLMGGSASVGNISPAAEFNFYTDPQAAAIVMRSGADIVMCGLDVTLQAFLTPEDLDELEASGTRVGSFTKACLLPALKGSRMYNLTGVCMHDSCPVMYLAHPELFEGEKAGVVVETRGTFTSGKSVTDLYSDKQFPFKNALVLLKVDRDRFASILKERILSIEKPEAV
ncbi:MAG: nucleoside hydrolase [Clostridia bacterium]|nr:nucleoside hydrolase [Clostridia bacterium]